MKTDSLSINDFILKIKTIGHTLATIGKLLNDKELLLVILNRLDQEYETVVSLITYQADEIDLEKVQYLLLMHEQRLSVKNFVVNFDSVSTMHVNVASIPSGQNYNFCSNRRGSFQRGNGYGNKGGGRG